MNGISETFEARLGRLMFAIAWVALGIWSFVYGAPVLRLEPWAKTWPSYAAVGYASGAVILLAGIGLMWAERAKFSASILAILTFLWASLMQLPLLLLDIGQGERWIDISEGLAAFGASWVLVSINPPRLITNLWDRILDNGIPIGRILFGIALLVFGVLHFIYHDMVTSLIPSWFPDRPLLATLTGVAHIAAGLAILSGVLGRLAATLAGIMYLSWLFFLHIPRIVLMARDPAEWNGAFLALMLSGAAFFVAATFIDVSDAGPK